MSELVNDIAIIIAVIIALIVLSIAVPRKLEGEH